MDVCWPCSATAYYLLDFLNIKLFEVFSSCFVIVVVVVVVVAERAWADTTVKTEEFLHENEWMWTSNERELMCLKRRSDNIVDTK